MFPKIPNLSQKPAFAVLVLCFLALVARTFCWPLCERGGLLFTFFADSSCSLFIETYGGLYGTGLYNQIGRGSTTFDVNGAALLGASKSISRVIACAQSNLIITSTRHPEFRSSFLASPCGTREIAKTRAGFRYCWRLHRVLFSGYGLNFLVPKTLSWLFYSFLPEISVVQTLPIRFSNFVLCSSYLLFPNSRWLALYIRICTS